MILLHIYIVTILGTTCVLLLHETESFRGPVCVILLRNIECNYLARSNSQLAACSARALTSSLRTHSRIHMYVVV